MSRKQDATCNNYLCI